MTNPMKSLLAATLAAGLAAPVFAAEPTANTVVATVGGEDITLGQMIVMSGQLPKQYQQLDDKTLFNAVRDQLVRQTAVAETVKD
ncbi:MAG: peptidylprolyl isomerase, partial [Paracoccaceae bacterium]